MANNLSPKVTAILLSYNRPRYFERALESLLAQTYSDLEILVVDNKSPSSPEIARIAGQHPRVRLLPNDRNLGFTGGMNRGLREARSEYLFLTEDDLLLDPQCLASLMAEHERSPGTSLLSGILYYEDGETILAAGGEMELASLYQKTLHGNRKGEKEFPTPFDAGYIPGSLVFARRATLLALGGFREDFFLYFEDDELCIRARKQGMRIRIVPAARARHLPPVPGPTSDEVEFHKYKNIVHMYLLHAALGVLPGFVFRYGVWEMTRRFVHRDRFLPAARGWLWNGRRLVSTIRERRGGGGK